MTLTQLVIYSLATWRIASLLVRESGPLDIFIHVRELTGIKHDEDGNIFMVPDTFLAGVLSCVWCCSMWVAMGWIAFWLLAPDVAIIFASLFAVSTGAIFMESILAR